MKARTIRQVVEEIKRKDPNSAIGYRAISRMIKDGTVPSVKVGNRHYVDLEAVERRFASAGFSDCVINK